MSASNVISLIRGLNFVYKEVIKHTYLEDSVYL